LEFCHPWLQPNRPRELMGATGSKQRKKANPVPHGWQPPFHAPE